MLHILLGDEPYLKDFTLQKLIAGVSDYERYSEWSGEVRDKLLSMSLFGGRKVISIHLGNLKQLGDDFISEIPLLMDIENVLVIVADDYDSRTTIFRKLSDKRTITMCEKARIRAKLSNQLILCAKSYGATFEEDALSLFEQLTSYGESNLSFYSLENDIKSLSSISKTITKQMVEDIVFKEEIGNCFSLIDKIEKRDYEGLNSQVHSLAGNEIGSMSAVLREYRLRYKELSGFQVGSRATCSKSSAVEAIDLLTECIVNLKNSSIAKDVLCLECLYRLCSLS